MSLKMMKKTLLVSAFLAVGSLAFAACGDDDGGDDTGGDKDAGGGGGEMGGGGDDAGAGPATRSWSGTLVAILAQDTSAPIKVPHPIVVLESETGKPLDPAVMTTTNADDGKWSLKDVPMAKPIAFWVKGQGSATDGTYDSVIINVTKTSAPDELTRISSASTASLAGQAAGFTAKQDRSALSGGVYYVKNGQRMGIIGCTQVMLDDDKDAAAAADLRYVNAGGLPTPPATQDKTEGSRGAFLFANIPTGKHNLKFTVDGGKTYFGSTDVYIGMTRDQASSAYKGILYQVGVELDEQKTPAGCM
jgi:hypothetical protein